MRVCRSWMSMMSMMSSSTSTCALSDSSSCSCAHRFCTNGCPVCRSTLTFRMRCRDWQLIYTPACTLSGLHHSHPLTGFLAPSLPPPLLPTTTPIYKPIHTVAYSLTYSSLMSKAYPWPRSDHQGGGSSRFGGSRNIRSLLPSPCSSMPASIIYVKGNVS